MALVDLARASQRMLRKQRTLWEAFKARATHRVSLPLRGLVIPAAIAVAENIRRVRCPDGCPFRARLDTSLKYDLTLVSNSF